MTYTYKFEKGRYVILRNDDPIWVGDEGATLSASCELDARHICEALEMAFEYGYVVGI